MKGNVMIARAYGGCAILIGCLTQISLAQGISYGFTPNYAWSVCQGNLSTVGVSNSFGIHLNSEGESRWFLSFGAGLKVPDEYSIPLTDSGEIFLTSLWDYDFERLVQLEQPLQMRWEILAPVGGFYTNVEVISGGHITGSHVFLGPADGDGPDWVYGTLIEGQLNPEPTTLLLASFGAVVFCRLKRRDK